VLKGLPHVAKDNLEKRRSAATAAVDASTDQARQVCARRTRGSQRSESATFVHPYPGAPPCALQSVVVLVIRFTGQFARL
jgi:hypothetical protein